MTGLTNQYPRTVRITAQYLSLDGSAVSNSPSVLVTVIPQALPGSVKNLVATAGTPGQVTLTWTPDANAQTDGVTGYKIYSSTTAPTSAVTSANLTSYSFVLMATASAPVSGYSINSQNVTGLSVGTSYWFAVVPIAPQGVGLIQTVQFLSTAAISAPTLVANSAVNTTPGQIGLAWGAPVQAPTNLVSSIVGYKVERCTDSTLTTCTVYTPLTDLLTYTVSGVSANTTYVFRITAVGAPVSGGSLIYGTPLVITTQSAAAEAPATGTPGSSGNLNG